MFMIFKLIAGDVSNTKVTWHQLRRGDFQECSEVKNLKLQCQEMLRQDSHAGSLARVYPGKMFINIFQCYPTEIKAHARLVSSLSLHFCAWTVFCRNGFTFLFTF
jgi:hypothetical protein